MAMPRGSGKTVLCQTAVVWSALIGATPFVTLIAASADRAKDLLENIKTWLETNTLLAEDFPEVDVMPNQMFIDLLPTGVSKGAGLGQLISHLGMERTEVTLHTFGDSWNDLSMHAIADRSYAFPWSPDEVMDAADEVIESVAPVLRRLA